MPFVNYVYKGYDLYHYYYRYYYNIIVMKSGAQSIYLLNLYINVNDDKHNAFLTNQLPLENFDPFFSFLCGVGIKEECSVRHDNPEKKKKKKIETPLAKYRAKFY